MIHQFEIYTTFTDELIVTEGVCPQGCTPFQCVPFEYTQSYEQIIMRSYDRIILDKETFLLYYIVDGGDRVSNQASTSDITAYLAKVKNLLSAGKYDFVPRRKNMQALAQHGLTITDAKNEILGLIVADYYKGPKQDFDQNRPGDIWEFKKDVDGTQFYVKVKIVQENGEDILKCLGFHEDDFA